MCDVRDVFVCKRGKEICPCVTVACLASERKESEVEMPVGDVYVDCVTCGQGRDPLTGKGTIYMYLDIYIWLHIYDTWNPYT